MEAVTNLGDAVLLLPASIALLGFLLWRGSLRAAAAWTAALAICFGLTVLGKLGLQACGTAAAALGASSPSGHVSFSTTFYGCCGIVSSAGLSRSRQIGVLFLAGLLVGLIAASRIVLGAHTPEEVVGGLLIGGTCVLLFRGLSGAEPARVSWLARALAAFIAAAILLNGQHLSAEPLIRQIAQKIGLVTGICR